MANLGLMTWRLCSSYSRQKFLFQGFLRSSMVEDERVKNGDSAGNMEKILGREHDDWRGMILRI